MKNKRIMSAAMAVLMAGSLAACGGSASSTADSTDYISSLKTLSSCLLYTSPSPRDCS